jgi:hypothetical protein
MAVRRNVSARRNRETRADSSRIIRAVDLPAADIDWRIRQIIEFDEFVVSAIRTSHSEFTDNYRGRGGLDLTYDDLLSCHRSKRQQHHSGEDREMAFAGYLT